MAEDVTNYTRLFDAALDGDDPIEVALESIGTLGGYDLLEKIGEGGMGLIWKAKEPKTGRIVALKQLRFIDAAMDSERAQEAAARFDREIGLASRLEHPGIARVYETGTDVESGSPFFTMELVDGEPLTGDGCEVKEKVRLLMAVCDAVEHAHRNGIIHRDLKPANILVNADGEVKILDFGVARALQESAIRSDLFNEDPAITISRNGEIFGTPQFMAPEQARGESSQSDTRTDVFALGTLLFRILTGEFAHSEKGGTWDVIGRVAAGDIRRPKEVCSEKVPPDLEAVLMKALAFSPDDRYSSAGELKRDLDRYLKGEPVRAQTLTTAYWLKRHVARHSTEWIAGLAIVLMVLIGGLAWGVQRTQFIDEQVRLRERAEAEEKGAKEAQSKSFVRIARDLRESGASAESLPYLARAINLDPDNRIARASLAAAVKQFPTLRRDSSTARFEGSAKEVVFGPDGSWFAVAIHRTGIRIYDSKTNDLIQAVPSKGKVVDMQLVPKRSNVLAVSLNDFDEVKHAPKDSGELLFVELGTGLVSRIKTNSFVSYFDFSSDGNWMVIGYGSREGTSGGIQFFDISDLSSPSPQVSHSFALPVAIAPRVAWSANSDQIYFTDGEQDGRLHRFDLRTGVAERTEIMSRLPGSRPYPLSHFNIAIDGRIVLSGEAGDIAVWSDELVDGPKMIWAKTIEGAGLIRYCRFSPDGKYIAGFTTRGRAMVWDSDSGNLLASLDHGERVFSGVFSPNLAEPLLLTRSDTDRVRLWNWKKGEEMGRPLESGQRILCADFSPDGKRILVGRQNHARMWGVIPRSWEPIVLDCGVPVDAVRIDSERNRILATSFEAEKAMVVSIPTGRKLGEWRHQASHQHQRGNHFVPAELSAKGRYFVTAESEKEVVVRRRGNFSEIRVSIPSRATALAFHPKEGFLAIGDEGTGTTVFQLDGPESDHPAAEVRLMKGSGLPFSEFDRPAKTRRRGSEAGVSNFVSHLSFSPAGNRLVSVEAPRALTHIYEWESGNVVRNLRLAGDTLSDLKITPNGDYYIVGGDELLSRVISVKDGAQFGPGRHNSSAIRKLCISADSKRFASGSSEGEVKFWNIHPTGENIPVVIPPQGAPVVSMARSSDGVLCASGDSDGNIKIWLMETGESLCAPFEVGSSVNDLAFHAKYPLLVAGCEDGKIRLWEIPSGKGRCASEFTTLAETMAGLFLNEDGVTKVGALYQYDQMRERLYTRYKDQVRKRETNPGYRSDEYHRLAYEILDFTPIEEPDWLLKDD